MDQLLTFFSWIFIYVFVFFLLQALLFRMVSVKQLLYAFNALAFLAAFATWIPFYFMTTAIFGDPMVRGLLAFAGAFGSLGFAGIYIVLGPISADRSLSAHMCMLMLAEGGKMPQAELLRRYNQDLIFIKRYDEYVRVGVMTRENGVLSLTSKGRRVAHIFLFFVKALKMNAWWEQK